MRIWRESSVALVFAVAGLAGCSKQAPPPTVAMANHTSECDPGAPSGDTCDCPRGHKATRNEDGIARCVMQVKDIVQPVKLEKQDPNGVEGGEEGGVVGGDYGREAPPPPPPPPPLPPQNVAPSVLDSYRIAGDTAITPNDATKIKIEADGKTKIVGAFKLCVNVDGAVSSVSQLKATGYPSYDADILNGMRQWRYRPYQVNGKAVPVCTAVTFVYSQRSADPATP